MYPVARVHKSLKQIKLQLNSSLQSKDTAPLSKFAFKSRKVPVVSDQLYFKCRLELLAGQKVCRLVLQTAMTPHGRAGYLRQASYVMRFSHMTSSSVISLPVSHGTILFMMMWESLI